MQNSVRTVVTFRASAFNSTEPRDYFINECCFGDDLCNWLSGRLTESGCTVDDEPGQEDFGWYLDFATGGQKYCFVCGFQPGDDTQEGRWIAWIERDSGFFASLFGVRDKDVTAAGPQVIHKVLSESPEVHAIKWHYKRDFDKNDESKPADSPTS